MKQLLELLYRKRKLFHKLFSEIAVEEDVAGYRLRIAFWDYESRSRVVYELVQRGSRAGICYSEKLCTFSHGSSTCVEVAQLCTETAKKFAEAPAPATEFRTDDVDKLIVRFLAKASHILRRSEVLTPAEGEEERRAE